MSGARLSLVTPAPDVDPLRASSAFRTVAALRRWQDAKPSRVMEQKTLRVPGDLAGMVQVKLFDGRELLAEAIDSDYFQALAVAVQIVTCA